MKLRVWMVYSIILLGLIVLFASCGSNQRDAGSGNPEAGKSPSVGSGSSTAVPVRVQEIQLESLELTAKATGVLRSRYQIPLSPEISGKVIEKVRDLGDALSVGDVILRLDPEPCELALAQARAGFTAAQVAYDQAQRDYQRAQELRASEDISEFELETSHLAERTAEANLRTAEAALKLAQRNLRLTELTSPINGHVARLEAQIGQQVAPGAPLGIVVSLNNLEIEVGLSERDIVNIKRGIEVRVRTDAFPNQVFRGKVRSVGVAGLDLGKTFPVIVAVDNSSGLLRPGMIAAMEMVYTFRQNVLAIPRSALVIGADQPTLYVLDGDVALRRQVELGPGNDQKIIVKSGLFPGERLVIEGQNVLSDSIQVKVL